METIETLTAGRTVIFVTHRLRSIVRADRIYLLQEGEVAEFGSHDELLARRGIYYRLWQTQDSE